MAEVFLASLDPVFAMQQHLHQHQAAPAMEWISVGTSTFSDAAGNQNSAASNTVTLAVDTVIPTISIASNKTALKVGETATLTFTLTESATDFTAEDISVSGGRLSTSLDPGQVIQQHLHQHSGSTSNGVISVGTSTFSDAAGNQNSAVNTVTLAVDTVIPTTGITHKSRH